MSLLRRSLSLVLASMCVVSLSSCWPLLVGAGATGGYVAHKEGYRVQSPVTKSED